jgi:aminoglycoside phosphotransferase (APT) family kinase protein
MTSPLTRVYSERLGLLTAEQFQAALDRFDLGELLDASSAKQGLFGQIVFLKTSSGDYVFRGNPHAGQLAVEEYFARRLHGRTAVPVAWPYLVERTTELFGWPYAIMRRLPGVMPLDQDIWTSLSPADRLAVAGALGEGLAELQSAAWPQAGAFDQKTGEIVAFAEPHGSRVTGEIERWLRDSAGASSRTTPADIAWVHGYVAAAKEALAVPFVPTFVHHDYKPGNAVMQQSAPGRWRVSGVFDFQEGFVGDGEEDLSRATCELAGMDRALGRAFVGAYLERRPSRPGFRERFAAYLIRDRLVIWWYGQKHGCWFPPELGLREWLEPQLAWQLF